MRGLFRPDVDLSKAGVILVDISSQRHTQFVIDLVAAAETPGQEAAAARGRAQGVATRHRLTISLDSICDRFGRVPRQMGRAAKPGELRNWKMKHDRRTPSYTTRWEDIPVVRA